MHINISIEDHVVPQLFTTAIEAYEIEHRAHLNGKSHKNLETFGLLWGYSIPQKGSLPARIVSTMATVETSALRHQNWVQPDFESIKSKKKFFEKYWPNIELVGTFHSHPYDNLSEVTKIKGWRASGIRTTGNAGDEEFWPLFHKEVSPEQPHLVHLIITIAKLEKRGWAYPNRLQGQEESKGYVLSADDRKLWLRAYTTEAKTQNTILNFIFSDEVILDIPSLQKRFL